MFSSFFYLLRERGLDVSLSEWMTLVEALDKGLARSSLTGFYYLCRAILVKTEADFDKFDSVFLEFFEGIEPMDEITEEMMSWLEHPDVQAGRPVDLERGEKNAFLTSEQVQKMFLERLKEQSEQHNSGSHWVGTGGTSVFGNSGYSATGIRVGGKSMHRRAFQVAGERKFRDFRNDNTLDTRQFQVAFRYLRQYSSRVDAAKTEFDIDATVHETSNNGGRLKIVYEKPRKNTVKVLLMMDSGGSMEHFSRLCSALFQSVNKSTHFKDLKVYYFHNSIYSKVFTEPTMEKGHTVETSWILQNLSSDYKVIFVGDAMMDPSELLHGSYYNFGVRDQTPGIEWFRKFKDKYEHIVWLNPAKPPTWSSYWSRTYDILREEFDMYPLTVKDLERALKKLLVAK